MLHLAAYQAELTIRANDQRLRNRRRERNTKAVCTPFGNVGLRAIGMGTGNGNGDVAKVSPRINSFACHLPAALRAVIKGYGQITRNGMYNGSTAQTAGLLAGRPRYW